MKIALYTLIILTIIVLVYRLSKKRIKEPTVVTEWKVKIDSAELSEQLYNLETNTEKKEELIYYFIQKLRTKDNYGVQSINKMPRLLRVIDLVNTLEMEVNNGGFLQFFTNPSGKYIPETIESLNLIKADFTKSLLERAIEIIKENDESIKNLNKKLNSLELYEIINNSDFFENEKLQSEMNELDMKYYGSTDNISKLKLEYFEKHQNELWKQIESAKTQ